MREAKKHIWHCLGQTYHRRTEGRKIFKLLFFQIGERKILKPFMVKLVTSQEKICIIQKEKFVFSLEV